MPTQPSDGLEQTQHVNESVERRIEAIRARGRTRTADDITDRMLFVFDELYLPPMTSQNANAMCNIVGKVMKLYEMQQKFGKSSPTSESNPDGSKSLTLISQQRS